MENFLKELKIYTQLSNELNNIEQKLDGSIIYFEGMECEFEMREQDIVLHTRHFEDTFKNGQQSYLISFDEFIEKLEEEAKDAQEYE